MTAKARQHGEAGRIGFIKAGLIMGGLMASLIGSQMLTGQEIATTQNSTASTGANGVQVKVVPQAQTAPQVVVPGNGGASTFQTIPSPSRQTQFYPMVRSRSSW